MCPLTMRAAARPGLACCGCPTPLMGGERKREPSCCPCKAALRAVPGSERTVLEAMGTGRPEVPTLCGVTGFTQSDPLDPKAPTAHPTLQMSKLSRAETKGPGQGADWELASGWGCGRGAKAQDSAATQGSACPLLGSPGAAPLTLKFGVSHQSVPGCELQPHRACCPDTAQSAPDPEFLLGCHLPCVVSRTMAPKEVHTPSPEPCTPTSPPGAKETADGSKSRI